ncbi:RbsD/FucU family protein [Gemmobacter denitrificans]|uniref:RbsD/FucU domain-containing protein n=1 Tax=Gemmobacter denitrificans TaxID=3123040 RepID=A0ABU8BZB4_9RHOB
MLIGIPPLLGPDLLFTLRAMGHGDEIALVDANYPAQTDARRLIRADGHGIEAVLRAILAVMPLDRDVPAPILRASLNNDPAQRGAVHHLIDRLGAEAGVAVAALPGAELYPRVRAAHAVVATGETALFANVILRKGVVALADSA